MSFVALWWKKLRLGNWLKDLNGSGDLKPIFKAATKEISLIADFKVCVDLLGFTLVKLLAKKIISEQILINFYLQSDQQPEAYSTNSTLESYWQCHNGKASKANPKLKN